MDVTFYSPQTNQCTHVHHAGGPCPRGVGVEGRRHVLHEVLVGIRRNGFTEYFEPALGRVAGHGQGEEVVIRLGVEGLE